MNALEVENHIIKLKSTNSINKVLVDNLINEYQMMLVRLRKKSSTKPLLKISKKTPVISSRYKGVTWKNDTKKWVARAFIYGKTRHLGCFTKEVDAYNECQRVLAGGNIKKLRVAQNKYKGVYKVSATGKWQAQATINGRKTHLGTFDTELEAHEMVLKVEK